MVSHIWVCALLQEQLHFLYIARCRGSQQCHLWLEADLLVVRAPSPSNRAHVLARLRPSWRLGLGKQNTDAVWARGEVQTGCETRERKEGKGDKQRWHKEEEKHKKKQGQPKKPKRERKKKKKRSRVCETVLYVAHLLCTFTNAMTNFHHRTCAFHSTKQRRQGGLISAAAQWLCPRPYTIFQTHRQTDRHTHTDTHTDIHTQRKRVARIHSVAFLIPLILGFSLVQAGAKGNHSCVFVLTFQLLCSTTQ